MIEQRQNQDNAGDGGADNDLKDFPLPREDVDDDRFRCQVRWWQ